MTTEQDRLEWVLREIETMNLENEHTFVPRTDLKLLATEIIRLRNWVNDLPVDTNRCLLTLQEYADPTNWKCEDYLNCRYPSDKCRECHGQKRWVGPQYEGPEIAIRALEYMPDPWPMCEHDKHLADCISCQPGNTQ